MIFEWSQYNFWLSTDWNSAHKDVFDPTHAFSEQQLACFVHVGKADPTLSHEVSFTWYPSVCVVKSLAGQRSSVSAPVGLPYMFMTRQTLAEGCPTRPWLLCVCCGRPWSFLCAIATLLFYIFWIQVNVLLTPWDMLYFWVSVAVVLQQEILPL